MVQDSRERTSQDLLQQARAETILLHESRTHKVFVPIYILSTKGCLYNVVIVVHHQLDESIKDEYNDQHPPLFNSKKTKPKSTPLCHKNNFNSSSLQKLFFFNSFDFSSLHSSQFSFSFTYANQVWRGEKVFATSVQQEFDFRVAQTTSCTSGTWEFQC